MTVHELINGITKGEQSVPFEHLVEEYNYILRSLCLMLPTSDASIELSAKDGMLECDLLPKQIKRVFSNGCELIPSSRELIMLLPNERLYHASQNGIYVTVSGTCRVFYRTLPSALTPALAMEEEVFGDSGTVLLIRLYLERAAYRYLGDYESADALAAEYNARLDDYKKANGVRE